MQTPSPGGDRVSGTEPALAHGCGGPAPEPPSVGSSELLPALPHRAQAVADGALALSSAPSGRPSFLLSSLTRFLHLLIHFSSSPSAPFPFPAVPEPGTQRGCRSSRAFPGLADGCLHALPSVTGV